MVMDGGLKIAEDKPESIASNSRVIEAYLGHGEIGRAADTSRVAS
jgi:hypothetical protein